MTTGEQTIIAPADVTARAAEVTAPTSGPVRQTGAQLLAFPPRPVASSWPATRASRLAVLAPGAGRAVRAGQHGASQQSRRLGVLAVLSWLATHPGESWQQRWQAGGAEDQSDWDAITLAAAGRRRAKKAPGTQLAHPGSGAAGAPPAQWGAGHLGSGRRGRWVPALFRDRRACCGGGVGASARRRCGRCVKGRPGGR